MPALLLDLAIDNIGLGEDWKLVDLDPKPGCRLLYLTRDQLVAVHYANGLVYEAAQAARVAFYGPDKGEGSATES